MIDAVLIYVRKDEHQRNIYLGECVARLKCILTNTCGRVNTMSVDDIEVQTMFPNISGVTRFSGFAAQPVHGDGSLVLCRTACMCSSFVTCTVCS